MIQKHGNTLQEHENTRTRMKQIGLGRLLVVADDTETVSHLCQVLSGAGYETAGFSSAREALEELKKHPFDLLLTDVTVPDMDVIALLRAALKIDPRILGIIMTGRDTIRTALEAMQTCAFDFVLKPLESEIMIALISRAMTVRRLWKELDIQREFSDAIFNNTASGIMVLDRDSYILKINPAGAEILNMSLSEVLSARLTTIYPEVKDMLVPTSNFPGEVLITLKGGKTIPVGFSNSPMLDNDGNTKGMIIVFRNITEIKELQAEVRKKQHFESMGKVISGVAHEIRNPLFGIQSLAQILERESESVQHQALISALLKETYRMRKLIDELLLYSKPSKLNMIELDLELFFAELQEFIKAKKYSAVLSINVPPFTTVKADKDKITQVFLNLLENAVSAGSKTIDITSVKKDGTLQISIRDDGIGIKPEDLERVFDPFFTTRKEGTGLGLPICKKIVEDHGGSLDLVSALGKGTAVVLTFKEGSKGP